MAFVFLFQSREPGGEFFAGGEEIAEADESSDHLDAGVDRDWGIDNAGEHHRTVLGEHIGHESPASSPFL